MELENEENEQKFKEHLSNVTFKFEKMEYKFEKLYEFLRKFEFPDKSFVIDISPDKNIYSLFNTGNIQKCFYFYTHLFDLELYDIKKGQKENKKVCSTYEIYNIINEKNAIFFYGNEKVNNKYICPLMIKNNKITLNYYTEKIDEIKFQDYIYDYNKEKNFEPKIFDNNFFSYFPELKYLEKNEVKIKYIETTKRYYLKTYILQYLQFNKIIKLTGPSGIGKSFFLLCFSRTGHNILYLNIAALIYLFNNKRMIELINMIITELNRLKLCEENYEELNKYFKNLKIVDLNSIMEDLINYFLEKKIEVIIIMDQFKTNYFNSWKNLEDLFNKPQSKIYLIICSSINDDNIRDSVCTNINNFIKREENIKDEIEEKPVKKVSEYFYISNLFDKESLVLLYNSEENFKIDENKKIIYELFDNIPKYVFKIKKEDNTTNVITKINENIINKFVEFYKLQKGDIKLKLKLSSLRRYIGHEFPIGKFNEIISNFTLKYFILKFYTKEGEVDFIREEIPIISFKIDYAFSYISEIIEEMAIESNDSFFDDGIYKEHTGSTIGGYFELIVIDKIKKKNILTLPNNNYEYIIRVDKINEMNVITMKMSNLIDNNLELLKEINSKENNRNYNNTEKEIIKENNIDISFINNNIKPKNNNDMNNDNVNINNKKSFEEEKSEKDEKFKEVINMKTIENNKEDNLTNDINTNNENSIKPSDLGNDNKQNNDDIFSYKIHRPFEQSEIVRFESNYLVQNSSISEIKNSFIKENDVRFYDKSNNLLMSSKLFETNKNKGNIKKIHTKEINNIFNNYHFLKDKNILVTQYYENAAAFDFAYLCGKKEEKIFIGFQVKSYRDYYEKRNFPISREKILEQMKVFLFNSKNLLDVDIIQINYIVIGLYFKNENNLKENVTYSEDLINYCNKNRFKLILYDPFEKMFLDQDKNYIKEIKIPDKYMNLLEEEEIQPFAEIIDSTNNFLKRKTNRELEIELMELNKNVKKSNDNEKLTISIIMSFVDNLKKELHVNKLKYAGSCKIINSYKLMVPKNNFLFLFHKNNYKEKEGLDKLNAFIQKENQLYVYDFETKMEIRCDFTFSYFNLFDLKKKYYIFKIDQ